MQKTNLKSTKAGNKKGTPVVKKINNDVDDQPRRVLRSGKNNVSDQPQRVLRSGTVKPKSADDKERRQSWSDERKGVVDKAEKILDGPISKDAEAGNKDPIEPVIRKAKKKASKKAGTKNSNEASDEKTGKPADKELDLIIDDAPKLTDADDSTNEGPQKSVDDGQTTQDKTPSQDEMSSSSTDSDDDVVYRRSPAKHTNADVDRFFTIYFKMEKKNASKAAREAGVTIPAAQRWVREWKQLGELRIPYLTEWVRTFDKPRGWKSDFFRATPNDKVIIDSRLIRQLLAGDKYYQFLSEYWEMKRQQQCERMDVEEVIDVLELNFEGLKLDRPKFRQSLRDEGISHRKYD